MSDLQVESVTKQTRQEKQRKKRINLIGWGIPLLLWISLALGSYFLAAQTILELNEQIEQVQQANQTQLDELTQNVSNLQQKLELHQESLGEITTALSNMEQGLQLVQEDLSLTGDTFNASDETKQALSQQITNLNKELEGLRASIKQLEEAARAY